MIDAKPKVRIRKYSCYYCDCTGILTKKTVIFHSLGKYKNYKLKDYLTTSALAPIFFK